jgi:hypothetical protein
MIAMARQSRRLVTNMVQNAIDSEEMLSRMDPYEICEIIKFSPKNLKEFFDASMRVVDDKRVPKFGLIENSPAFLLDPKQNLDYEYDLPQILKWRENNPNLHPTQELPVVL